MIAAVHRRTALIWLVTIGAVALACLPAVVTFGLGWIALPHVTAPGEAARDTTTLGQWTVFALFYLVWMTGLMVLLVWTFDRIGYHWHAQERRPRVTKKAQRRARATARALNAEQQATHDALRRREQREAQRRRDRERDEALRRGPDGRGGAGGGR